MTIFKYNVNMCQIVLHTEFQHPTMFCTLNRPTEHKYLLYTSQNLSFKCVNIPKFYLLVSDEAVF